MLFLNLLVAAGVQAQDACVQRDYGNGGTVCVCDVNQCDTIPSPKPQESSQYTLYTSSKAGLRFKKEVGDFALSTTECETKVIIDSDKTYQQILGWGGAFTDATGINIASLDEELQEKLLGSYFSSDGIEYSLCRVPIGGTDFSTHGYSYNDGDEDKGLVNFALAEEDHKYKIPYILKAKELSKNTLELFASAWTAPKWMKTNEQYAGFGYLKDDMYQSWANYFVKFLDEYQKQNITFWGITTGNEPNTILFPDNKINTVGWTPQNLGKWLQDILGPTVRNSKHSKIKLIILDDQKTYISPYLDKAFSNTNASDYVDGIGVHWYLDFLVPESILSDAHKKYPDKFILATEACHIPQSGESAVDLGSWDRGEKYSEDILEDLLNWTTGWIDWNMVLNTNGGPTYIDNFVDSPIIVNATGGEFYKQPMFYHLGHFSKFIPKGSIRIDVTSEITNLTIAAFQRPDNGTAIVILNRANKQVPICVSDKIRGSIQIDIAQKSINTILYW